MRYPNRLLGVAAIAAGLAAFAIHARADYANPHLLV